MILIRCYYLVLMCHLVKAIVIITYHASNERAVFCSLNQLGLQTFFSGCKHNCWYQLPPRQSDQLISQIGHVLKINYSLYEKIRRNSPKQNIKKIILFSLQIRIEMIYFTVKMFHIIEIVISTLVLNITVHNYYYQNGIWQSQARFDTPRQDTANFQLNVKRPFHLQATTTGQLFVKIQSQNKQSIDSKLYYGDKIIVL